jgi:hypothetical protein
MSYTEEYRELIEDARDAVNALLDVSTHHSWATLRRAYGDLVEALWRDEGERLRDELREVAALEAKQREDRFAARDGWLGMVREARENRVLDVLGEGRWTIRQVMGRLNGALGCEDGDAAAVYEGDVRRILRRMCAAGQLERAPERFQGKIRYRYFRKVGLHGAIAELDRAYRDGRAA